ncbi:hypothetical protein C6P46_000007 [Rhodotorula mucilaginosa]|uniref:LysM domain-containing protein n=1 Tax=Rhodotorula mucilaginosa TaxID=5537 RepID=A0A9P7B9D1_RHOMI|nr:hypothetical protein C6P46_000007 [Rhodotorula mucilaginosa]TKA57390.1 hypothetical protein B0A53_00619 [Rhodotorula sp. CCFEE 5036]
MAHAGTGADEILGVASSASSQQSSTGPDIDDSTSAQPPPYGLGAASAAAADFVLGDDDDSADEENTEGDQQKKAEQDGGLVTAHECLPEYVDVGASASPQGRQLPREKERPQPHIHYLRPEDTLLGLSMQYGIDGRALCRHNSLPPSTLSTTPQLLHTRPFILLPPGARPSASTEPLLSPALERRRLIVRRFQTQTKCTDWAMATAYVDQVFDAREKEAALVKENRQARGDAEEVQVREGGELEEAVQAFLADERWEREQRNQKGKGRGLFNIPRT